MRIIIATGGTGGHIFPALNVAAELERDGHDLFFLGVFGKAAQRMMDQGYAFEELPARGLTGYSLGALISIGLRMVRSFQKSFQTIGRYRPNAVIGFGGYASFPVLLAAVLRRIPTVIHEQNVIPGRANAVLANFVNVIAVSFEESKQYFPEGKTVFTGCPIRFQRKRDRESAYRYFSLQKGKLTILVFGGSQGAKAINQVFEEMLPDLQESLEFQIIHLTGSQDLPRLQEFYSKREIPCFLSDFLEEIDLAYSIADVVISRAGALTVTELAAFVVPAILVPYPYAGGHQKANAKVLEQIGLVRIIAQADLNAEVLRREIIDVLSRRSLSEETRQAVKQIFKPKAAAVIASEVARRGKG
jgi:UDP-N-acetylglucosamine--N-acetylmuramyl-(pentapeptide) pyrophosphoryl-undecaprenol N-acetylglucosamine transferase